LTNGQRCTGRSSKSVSRSPALATLRCSEVGAQFRGSLDRGEGIDPPLRCPRRSTAGLPEELFRTFCPGRGDDVERRHVRYARVALRRPVCHTMLVACHSVLISTERVG
jgi:hypothetical protein